MLLSKNQMVEVKKVALLRAALEYIQAQQPVLLSYPEGGTGVMILVDQDIAYGSGYDRFTGESYAKNHASLNELINTSVGQEQIFNMLKAKILPLNEDNMEDFLDYYSLYYKSFKDEKLKAEKEKEYKTFKNSIVSKIINKE